MKKNAFLLPKRLGENVIQSQILPLVHNTDILVTSETRQCYSAEGNIISPRDLLSSDKKKIINKLYVRDCIDFIFILFLKKVFRLKFRIFYDFRAIVFEEMKFKDKPFYKVFIIRMLEKIAYLNADELGSVSHNLSNRLHKEFKVKKKITVHPSCCSWLFKRDKPYGRKILYVGGISSWQKFDEILTCFNALSRTNSGYEFTVITSDVNKAREKCQFTNVNNIIIKSCDHNLIAEEIMQHDFGIIVRDDHVINKVSSPIKLSEYICSGLIPICTNNIGDLSGDLLSNNCAVEYSNNFADLDKEINKFVTSDYKSISCRIYNKARNYHWKTRDVCHGFNK